MKEVLESLLNVLQQGIAAIFKVVEMIWTWASEQVNTLLAVPWQSWPAIKQVFFAIIVVAVVFGVVRVAMDLWFAGERILAAFATLLGVFVSTLPSIIVASLIALGGLWVLNNVDLSHVRLPTFAEAQPAGSPPAQNP